MRKIIKIVSDVLFITGLTVAGLFLVGHFTGQKPFQVFIVSSGSMEPAIKTGSIIVVSPKSDYQITDIATYYSGLDKKSTTTHRIVATDGKVYKMAGDANDQPDPLLVPREKIIGTVRFSVPYLGFLAAQAKTPKGFILLVIVPATIIIYEELRSLIQELKKISSKLFKKKLLPSAYPPVPDNIPNPRSHYSFKPAIVLPIFFALLIPLTLSISYFIDRETSSGNSFTGSAPAPTEPLSTLNSQLSTDTITPEPTPLPTEVPAQEGEPTPIPQPTPEITPTNVPNP